MFVKSLAFASAINSLLKRFQFFLTFFENFKGIVSINDRLPNGWTALHFAVEENKIKMARFIIDYGAEIEGMFYIEDLILDLIGVNSASSSGIIL